MTVTDMFQTFLQNLTVNNSEQITQRYEEITASLNKTFRDTESKTANSLQVGSYGRWTAIKGVSDLDMLYIMPAKKWDEYNCEGGQSELLNDTKKAILDRYPRTSMYVDRLVVRVLYGDFHIEVQPVFEQNDGSFKYPDTYKGGSWKTTKPREEISAMSTVNAEKNRNLRRLCKMARAWKNKHGVGIGGLLIDTLAHNFLQSTTDYDDKSYLYYDYMSRDFFKYLSEEPSQDRYAALGSGQHVKIKEKFQKKAKKAYDLCLKAIGADGSDSANDKWKKVYGRPFPATVKEEVQKSALSMDAECDNTEEFIEDKYPIDIRYPLNIECEVKQRGFREHFLRYMLANGIELRPEKKLVFYVESCGAPKPYRILWKVLNRGSEARRRNCMRGQIFEDSGHGSQTENTNFSGSHIVECYVLLEGVIVAKDRIDVPIR